MNDLQNTEQDAEVILATIEQAVIEVNGDIDETDRHAVETLLHVESRVDATTAEIEALYGDLESAEKQTEEALDILILNQLDDE